MTVYADAKGSENLFIPAFLVYVCYVCGVCVCDVYVCGLYVCICPYAYLHQVDLRIQ